MLLLDPKPPPPPFPESLLLSPLPPPALHPAQALSVTLNLPGVRPEAGYLHGAWRGRVGGEWGGVPEALH